MDGAVGAGFASVLVSDLAPSALDDSAGFVLSPDDSDFLAFGDEYKSAYQPTPLRIKVPPLICLRAVRWVHCGQRSMGSAVIL